MAVSWYTSAKNAIIEYPLLGTGGFTTKNQLRAALVTSTYTFSAAHTHLDDVTGTITTGVALSSLAVTDGTLTSANPVITANDGVTFNAVIVYQHNATAASADLVLYDDSVGSIIGNGGTVTIDHFATGIANLDNWTDVYDSAKEIMLNKALFDTGGFGAGTLTWVFTTSTYAENLAADDFYDDVTGSKSGETVIGGASVSGGAFDANDATCTTTDTVAYDGLLLWMDTGVDATSDLIIYKDTTTDSSLPKTSNGGAFTYIFGASILAL